MKIENKELHYEIEKLMHEINDRALAIKFCKNKYLDLELELKKPKLISKIKLKSMPKTNSILEIIDSVQKLRPT